MTLVNSYRAGPDERGHFGIYGGRFVAETLMPLILELEQAYEAAKADPAFQAELDAWLKRLCRPAEPALLRRAADRRSSAAPRSTSSATSSTTPARTRSTTASARSCWPGAWARRRIIAETGAGQHGVATATVAARFGLPCVVYMGEVDIARQQPNVFRMRLLGAEVRPVTSGSRDAQGRDERGAARLGHQRRRHLLHHRQRRRAAPLPGHGARLPVGDRPRGARADPRSGGPAAGHARGLRRRRLQRHRPVPPVPRRPRGAHRSASRPRATASRPGGTRPR